MSLNVLKSLHWLDTNERIEQMLLLTNKTPTNIQSICLYNTISVQCFVLLAAPLSSPLSTISRLLSENHK